MRKPAPAALLAAILALSPVAAAQEKPPETPPPPAPAAGEGPAAAPAPAPPKDPVGEARRLHAEAKEFFAVAGDTDLPRDERKKARKEAYPRLEKAKKYLDDWFVDHPDDADRHQDLYKDISIMLFWIRKEAGVGELDGTESKPKPKPPVAPAPGPSAPEPPKPPTAAESLAKIREYEKTHPGDVPGLHEQYTAFLAAYSDPASPQYEEAVRRLEELGKALKDVYRLARDDDPDALSGSDPAEVEKLVDQLAPDLESPEIAVRERAARYLGNLGSGRAAQPLVKALLSEKEPMVLEALKEALSRLGGRRVCERLVKEKPGSPASATVVDVLLRIVKKGGVNGRIAGEFVAAYAPGLDDPGRAEVAAALAAAGKDAAVGLALVVDYAPVEKKVEYLDLLGQWAEPRTAGYLTRFLMTNPQGARRSQHQAARKAIEAIGKPGVRWLIPALDDKNCAVWTAEMLKQITGAKPKDDKRKTWEEWYRKNRRTLETK